MYGHRAMAIHTKSIHKSVEEKNKPRINKKYLKCVEK